MEEDMDESSDAVSKVLNPEKVELLASSDGEATEKSEDPLKDESEGLATIFCIELKQSPTNLQHKTNVPGLFRNFSAVAWCGKLNCIACAAETCASISSSAANPPFWIPLYIVIPERPTECTVLNVIADSPRDSVQFIEWSPGSCPRALLVSNSYGRVTILTQPSQGPANLVRDALCWQREHEWRQDFAIVTKWISGVSPYKWLSPNTSSPTAEAMSTTIKDKFISRKIQNSVRWPNFLCVCSVFSSGLVQLHWSQWPPSQSDAAPKWFGTSKALLSCGPSRMVAADVTVTDDGSLHVAGVPFATPSTVVVWEVLPGHDSGCQAISSACTTAGPPCTPSLPSWQGFPPLVAHLLCWQEYLVNAEVQERKNTRQGPNDIVPLRCLPVSNFSAYVSPRAAGPSGPPPSTWASGVTAVAFDPTCGGSVITVVIAEGRCMSPSDPGEGLPILGWRVQRWEASRRPVVLHQLFGNPMSCSAGGKESLQTVWVSDVSTGIPASSFLGRKADSAGAVTGIEKAQKINLDPFDLCSIVRNVARIVYSSHGGEVAIALLHGGVGIFSASSLMLVDNYHVNVGSAVAAPAFSSTSCCSASVWHDVGKGCTMLKVLRVIPPITSGKFNATSSWERAIAERFWWGLFVGVDWWDVIGCAQSAAEDEIVSLSNLMAVLDEDFHSLPSVQHRQLFGHSLDRIKCRLLEGTNSQEARAMVIDMQTRLLLDMLGKGIESAMINPSGLVPEPWQTSGESFSGFDVEALAIEPCLLQSIQAYVDVVLDLALHFVTRLRRYTSFCRTLAIHATGGTTNRLMTNSSQSSIASQGSSSFMPISINSGTFPGTPAVRLIGDCHFLHRLCQLLFFCFFFRRMQLARSFGGVQKNIDSNLVKSQSASFGKVDISSVSSKFGPATITEDEGQVTRGGYLMPMAKLVEDGAPARLRMGNGNASQGYTYDEVKVLFLIIMDLCRRTSSLAHPLPVSLVGASNIQVRLHYIDGDYNVLPEVVEASLGPHVQNMPRPRGLDAAALLLRELELHPPSEDWHRRNTLSGFCSNSNGTDADDCRSRPNATATDSLDFGTMENRHFPSAAVATTTVPVLWPRKRRLLEREAALGLNTSVGLGAYLGLMGSRRDVITGTWKSGLKGIWYKCIRCMRQTSAFASPDLSVPAGQNDREAWWASCWACACPMCGGTWVRVV